MKLISIPTIAKEFNKDASQVHKDVRNLNFELYEATSPQGRRCTAISKEDYKKLTETKAYSFKILDKMPKGGTTLITFCQEKGLDESNVRKAIKRMGLLLDKAKTEEGTVYFLTPEQLKEVSEKFAPRVIAE